MNMDKLMSTAKQPTERLRWKVLRALGISPFSAEARAATDDDILKAAAQLVLDARQQRVDEMPCAYFPQGFEEVVTDE